MKDLNRQVLKIGCQRVTFVAARLGMLTYDVKSVTKRSSISIFKFICRFLIAI